jgi:hypothetical protein
MAELMARLGHSTPQAAMRYQHAAQSRDREIAVPLSKDGRERGSVMAKPVKYVVTCCRGSLDGGDIDDNRAAGSTASVHGRGHFSAQRRRPRLIPPEGDRLHIGLHSNETPSALHCGK